MKSILIAGYLDLSAMVTVDILRSRRDRATTAVLVAIVMIPLVGAGLY